MPHNQRLRYFCCRLRCIAQHGSPRNRPAVKNTRIDTYEPIAKNKYRFCGKLIPVENNNDSLHWKICEFTLLVELRTRDGRNDGMGSRSAVGSSSGHAMHQLLRDPTRRSGRRTRPQPPLRDPTRQPPPTNPPATTQPKTQNGRGRKRQPPPTAVQTAYTRADNQPPAED